MSSTFTSTEATQIHSLTSLIATTSSASPSSSARATPGPSRTIYPTEDTITSLLASRFRLEQPCIRVGQSGRVYVVVNPFRTLTITNEESRRTYQDEVERTEPKEAGTVELQPSVFELAGRVWMLMRRRKEFQAVLFHGLTGSGKSTASQHFTSQILQLSSPTKAHHRVADQITSLLTLLESFGNSKTPLNPSASQHARYFELHFSSDGGIAGANVLPFGLNKSRLSRLRNDERSFHVFYQLLAGASPEERDALDLEDPSSYALLSRSGCYRLPGGPFSDDSAQMGELRVAFACLGFKPKHVRSIFTILTTILLLSNLTFVDDTGTGSLGMTSMDEPARIEDKQLLMVIAVHLGVEVSELEMAILNLTKWTGEELCSVVLNAKGAEEQRDDLMQNLYAILFAFVVEMANKKLAPSEEVLESGLRIVQLDIPGFASRTSLSAQGQSRSMYGDGPLVEVAGQNGFDEFTTNWMNEMIHSYLLRRDFMEDCLPQNSMADDGIRLPEVATEDNAACIEVLRGGPLDIKRLETVPEGIFGVLNSSRSDTPAMADDEEAKGLVWELNRTFGHNPSYLPNSASLAGLQQAHRDRMFGINHFAGTCNYDARDFTKKNTDIIDRQLVDLLRMSSDSFISKLLSGPGLAAEGHPHDPEVTVETQVSVTPLRTPTSLNQKVDSDAVREWPLDTTLPHPVATQLNAALSTILQELKRVGLWHVACIRPNDAGQPNSLDKRLVKGQVKALLLPELVNRLQVDWIADYAVEDFCIRHGLSTVSPPDSIDSFATSFGWIKGEDYVVGRERIWLGWNAWKEQEDILLKQDERQAVTDQAESSSKDLQSPHLRVERYDDAQNSSAEELLLARNPAKDYPRSPDTPGMNGLGYLGYRDSPDYPPRGSFSFPKVDEALEDKEANPAGLGLDGDGEMIVHTAGHHSTEVLATTRSRRWWLRITWMLTWWIPSFLLVKLGGMKRPDVRLAWREKVAIFMMVMFMCAIVLFYIVGFGMLLCPDKAKAWNPTELAEHAGTNDYYAAIAGQVYDFTKFYKGQHSDIAAYPTTSQVMLEFAGQDLTDYFPPPMNLACPALVDNSQLALMRANFTPVVDSAVHTSGALQTTSGTKLDDQNWYTDTLLPDLAQYHKGSFVYAKSYVADQANGAQRQWAIYKKKVYDLSDYLYTVQYYAGSSGTDLPNYSFLNSDVTSLFSNQAGQDITSAMDSVFDGMSDQDVQNTLNCLNMAFYVGELDYRQSARCTVQNYLLLAFSIILVTTIASKFLAALQLGSKRNPENLDKYIICQVPCYTEGEESLRRTIDSLATLKYDDRKKLLFIICDGNVVGASSRRHTPAVVLDILGSSTKDKPEPLMYKSVGEGSRQLNYAKVYSGLYEHEGHVVPYMVIVKVGKPTEVIKPGNRGKRDSQVMLLHYLNRVHFDAPMSPLELEICHQMRNIIGVDPTFYEYIFQVDADTTVTPDSLNRLISCAADDQRIIGICGETKIENEQESLTTMIQVYEYYISHHLTKAFESLFGSVTCLPGCFSVYRIRTADKGRPVIISSLVIDEYAEPNVDTLHKKNLFSLGEDRYLTTLMMKHFPTFKLKFTPDAVAYTIAPSNWSVLLSQRRRWINSTVHNLVELLALPEMCGFCCFSMRFVVFIDLLGTIILPATFGYLVYLIVVVSTGKAPIPVISLIMIGAVYGLQAIIFLLKREFMLVGWMIVYILAFPVYSVFLPLYSFWSMDDFSWGSTRKVVGEGNNKTVVYEDEEPFNASMIPLKSFSEYENQAWETASLRSENTHFTTKTRTTTRTTTRTGRGGRPATGYRSVSDLLPPGGDYWRDSSPIQMARSSQNLRNIASNPSLRGSIVQPPLHLQSYSGLAQAGPSNPFESPAGSEYGGSTRPTPFLSPFGYMSPQLPHMGIQVPRNSVMSNLAGRDWGGVGSGDWRR